MPDDDLDHIIGDDTLDNAWERRALGLSSARTVWERPVKHSDVVTVTNRHSFVELVNTGAREEMFCDVEMYPSRSGWLIHYFGEAMTASAGRFMLDHLNLPAGALPSEKSTENDDDEGGAGEVDLSPWEFHGYGTVAKQAVVTAEDMIQTAVESGWSGVNIVGGSEHMRWAAWLAADARGLEVTGYEPDEYAKKRRDRLKKLNADVEPGAAPQAKR